MSGKQQNRKQERSNISARHSRSAIRPRYQPRASNQGGIVNDMKELKNRKAHCYDQLNAELFEADRQTDRQT